MPEPAKKTRMAQSWQTAFSQTISPVKSRMLQLMMYAVRGYDRGWYVFCTPNVIGTYQHDEIMEMTRAMNRMAAGMRKSSAVASMYLVGMSSAVVVEVC